MGRGSDTRMYSPRSESSHMYGSANEDGGKYSPTSSEDAEKRREEKQVKDEERRKKLKDIKHIKIKPSQGLGSGPKLPTEEGLDDGNKRDDEREISLQGGPAGSRGHLLDMATGAKTGTGSAMGTGNSAVRTGEPMEDAWSTLLKGTELKDFIQQYPDIKFQTQETWDSPLSDKPLDYGITTHGSTSHLNSVGNNARSRTMNPQRMDILQRFLDRSKAKPKIIQQVHGNVENPYYVPPGMKSPPLERENSNPNYRNEDFYDAMDFEEPITQEMIDEHFERYNIQSGEPIDGAWSTLLKASVEDLIQERDRLLESGLNQEAKQFDRVIQQMMRPDQQQQQLIENLGIPSAKLIMPELGDEELTTMGTEMMHEGKQNPDYIEMQRRMDEYDPQTRQEFMRNISRMARRMPQIEENRQLAQQNLQSLEAADPTKFFADQQVMTGEPMEMAWRLLKRDTPKTIQARRRREGRQNFRPSTGQFKKPPGGQSGGAGATMRRFKARMRGIKGGKRTGLMKPHLSVEMSHRGIATKQPMSKDPQKYRQYMGQQEAQKILGGIRNTYSPHARHSARSFQAGPTGGGRLTGMLPGQAGQMRQPSLANLSRPRRPRRPRMPRMPRMPMAPQMPMMPPAPPAPIMTSEDTPSQIMMSSDRTQSDILKANRHANKLEMLELMRRLISIQKRRNKLTKYVQGGGSAFEDGHVPTHPAGVHQHEDEDEKNDGPTQNLETNSSRLGLDPAGHLSGKRGHFG